MKHPAKRIAIAIAVLLAASLSITGCSSSGGTISENKLVGTISSDIVRQPSINTADASNATVLIYMNGSNLESDYQAATDDLGEMIAAGSSDKINVVVQTMGTKSWSSTYSIASDHTQRYKVTGDGLELVDDSLGQLDLTKPGTLADFIGWSVENYPADRYILLFWDHGGGPVYGFGSDEFNPGKSMTIDAIQRGIAKAGVYFDFVGMDCCIMSCMEVCASLYGYCDYAVLSEDFEPCSGWAYTPWLSELYKDPSMDSKMLGKCIVDAMVDSIDSHGTLTMIDESMMKVLFSTWTDFAYANEKSLVANCYAELFTALANGRTAPQMLDGGMNSKASLAEYQITDIMAVAQNIDSEESRALASAVSQAIVYSRSTEDDRYLTGLSVTLPYANSSMFEKVKTIFSNCGIDSRYIKWLKKISKVSSSTPSYDFSSWTSQWSGWSHYEDDYDWNAWSHYDDAQYWDEFDASSAWSTRDYSDSWNAWAEDNPDASYSDYSLVDLQYFAFDLSKFPEGARVYIEDKEASGGLKLRHVNGGYLSDQFQVKIDGSDEYHYLYGYIVSDNFPGNRGLGTWATIPLTIEGKNFWFIMCTGERLDDAAMKRAKTLVESGAVIIKYPHGEWDFSEF